MTSQHSIKEIAFTGTIVSHHKTPDIINSILDTLDPSTKIRTGAAWGVDEAAAVIGKSRGFHIITYVPANRSKIDLHFADHCDEVIDCPTGVEPYRIRNTQMVSIPTNVDKLYAIALYREDDLRSRRSGTYMTVRIAQKKGIPVEIYLLEEEEIDVRLL